MGATLLKRPYSPPSLMGGYGTRTPAGILIPSGFATEVDEDEFSPLDLSPSWWVEGGLSPAYQEDDTVNPVTAAAQTWGRWDDLSGNGRNVLQATASKRAVAVAVNGILVPDFDGTDDFLALAAVALGAITGLTLAAVVQIDAATSFGMALTFSAQSELRQEDTTRKPSIISLGAGSGAISADAQATGAPNIWIGTVDDSTDTFEIFVNGVSKGTNTGVNALTTTGTLSVGVRSGGSLPWSGPICAGLVLPYKASAGQIAQIQGYWKPKWGTP